MEKLSIAFDVGGTFIKHGLVASSGELLEKGKVPTPREDCGRNVVGEIIRISEMYMADGVYRKSIVGIGVSTAGIVDTSRGLIVSMNENMPGYTGTPIGDLVAEATGIPCSVDNDVNCAASGELWMGCGRGETDFAMVSIGTGIGMAIVMGGSVYRGKNGFAGEVGHMTIVEDGRACPCGMKGCFEMYASSSALVRDFARRTGGSPGIDGEGIFRLASSGHIGARETLGDYVGHLATGLINVAYILDPGLIIIGGGISGQGEALMDMVRAEFKGRCQKDFARGTRMLAASLGNDASLTGAGRLAFG